MKSNDWRCCHTLGEDFVYRSSYWQYHHLSQSDYCLLFHLRQRHGTHCEVSRNPRCMLGCCNWEIRWVVANNDQSANSPSYRQHSNWSGWRVGSSSLDHYAPTGIFLMRKSSAGLWHLNHLRPRRYRLCKGLSVPGHVVPGRHRIRLIQRYWNYVAIPTKNLYFIIFKIRYYIKDISNWVRQAHVDVQQNKIKSTDCANKQLSNNLI